MSRRDTIIVALLVNAGLLAVLFMLAVNKDEEKVIESLMISPIVNEASTAASLSIPSGQSQGIDMPVADEVDSYLKNLPAEDLAKPIVIDEDLFEDLEKEVVSAPSMDSEIAKEASKEVSGGERVVEVTIKRGDALERIARNNGTTVEAIKKANNLKSTKLSIGQVLKIPVNSKTASQAGKKSSEKIVENESSTSPQYHTVESGDSPWKIAKKYHVKFEDLLKLNGLDEEKARNLKIGDRIRVR